MVCEVPRVDKHADAQTVTRYLEAAGCVIVENLYDEPAMDQLLADLNPWLEKRLIGVDDFSGYKTRRVSSLVARSQVARDLALDKMVLDVCDRLLLPNCEVYRLQVTHMVDIGPGEIRQILHRDDTIYPEIFHRALPTLNCLVHGMWAVSDFSAENGATSLVPGSHLWEDRDRKPEEHEITQAVMPKGSVALYLVQPITAVEKTVRTHGGLVLCLVTRWGGFVRKRICILPVHLKLHGHSRKNYNALLVTTNLRKAPDGSTTPIRR